MTDKPTFHPKPGRIDATPRLSALLTKAAPHKGGFDPAAQGHWPGGPKGAKGRAAPLHRKVLGR